MPEAKAKRRSGPGAQASCSIDAEFDEPDLELADGAAGSVGGGPSPTRLGPLPPLQMDPGADPILGHYRAPGQAERYGRTITTDDPAWPTWS